jgi:hypothetical protein
MKHQHWCMPSRGRVKRFAIRVVSDEYLDLYILVGAALAFTVLGIVGVASIKVLASAIVALLAVLAFSQVRSRRHVAEIARGQRSDPLSVFQAEFPDDLESRRGSASSLLLWRGLRGRNPRQPLRNLGAVRGVLHLPGARRAKVRPPAQRQPVVRKPHPLTLTL